ncbi:DeoR faimly transcriptional regulator [Bacillus sp. FJAT-27231]|uniref:DeoR/GlpR family DNA-binding transcription regulator n=1 Tax=Bacillus sp. FJAT-27231 TaxID=1679168 RepID=UPI00067119AF|nr:DeoR/GlpR family DNA-binding transcription regulator [Bacillus sp. FJAT-27231]KMY53775.1 DeoR faimly transcriptional regulator [Bacillus sp. FJAT-27231]
MSLSFEERKKTILEILEIDEKVKVRSVEKILNVSGETIRRDLDRLEKEGLVKKVYGGAIKAKNSIEPSFDQKTTINTAEKLEICQMAASLVEDGDVIFIGHGTTAYELVRFLNNKKNVTVVTSSLPVLMVATEQFNGNIIFIGGEYEGNQKFTSGPLAQMILEQLRADKAFIAAGGVSLNDGISDYDLAGASNCKKMIERAEEVIILADSSKFGRTTFAKICSLSDVSTIITDEHCPKQWGDKLLKHNIELLIANNKEYVTNTNSQREGEK